MHRYHMRNIQSSRVMRAAVLGAFTLLLCNANAMALTRQPDPRPEPVPPPPPGGCATTYAPLFGACWHRLDSAACEQVKQHFGVETYEQMRNMMAQLILQGVTDAPYVVVSQYCTPPADSGTSSPSAVNGTPVIDQNMAIGAAGPDGAVTLR